MHHTFSLHWLKMRILLVATAAMLALGAAVAPPGGAAAGSPSPHMWATINVCDTIAHPDTIGIRGSIPGSGKKAERMFMRFQVQYFVARSQQWHNIPKDGDSGFVFVGSGRFKARQAGETFRVAPPAGGSWNMRGAVTFEWKLNGRLEQKTRLLTTAGHRSTAGSDPQGYSSDTCVIS
jgi:hypothetical protein